MDLSHLGRLAVQRAHLLVNVLAVVRRHAHSFVIVVEGA